MANSIFLRTIIHIVYLGLIPLTISCSPLAADLRNEGSRLTQQAFESFEQTPELYEVIELRNIKIYIVGDRKHFKWNGASAYGSPILGYATENNDIYIFGKRVGNKIIINETVLGHELNHLLNFQNPEISNPDKLDKLELCYKFDSKTDGC